MELILTFLVIALLAWIGVSFYHTFIGDYDNKPKRKGYGHDISYSASIPATNLRHSRSVGFIHAGACYRYSMVELQNEKIQTK